MAGQVYSVSTLGGNHSVPYLSEKIRSAAQPSYYLRQFIDAKEAIGLNKGNTFNFDKTGNVLTQGGTLVETSTIPETEFLTQQGTVTITEYGNSVPFTGKLDALGQFQLSPMIEQKLRDDQTKVLESAAGNQFAATEFIAVCSATNSVVMTTNGTATATASTGLSASNVRAIVDFMKKRAVPKYDGRSYICVGSVQAFTTMHGDTAAGGWNDISKYTESFAQTLHNGELGSYYGVRFVEEMGAAFLSNTVGLNSAHGQCVFFGADSVYEAVSIPEEIRMKVSTDFGRDLGLAWYALLGFKKVWDFAVDAEQHIVFVTSA